MRHQSKKAVLLLQHFGLGAQSARDHSHAQRERQEEEAALPGILVDTAVALLHKCRIDGARRRSTAVRDGHVGQKCLHALRGYARREQRLRRGDLAGVRGARIVQLLGAVVMLIVDPPANLDHRNDDQQECRHLENSGGLHGAFAATRSDSRSASAKNLRS